MLSRNEPEKLEGAALIGDPLLTPTDGPLAARQGDGGAGQYRSRGVHHRSGNATNALRQRGQRRTRQDGDNDQSSRQKATDTHASPNNRR